MVVSLLLLVGVVALDQVSKALIVSTIPEGAATSAAWGVRLRHVVNRHARWRSSRGRMYLAICWLLVIVTTMELITSASSITQLGLGAAIGGATGNAIDAMFRRRIIDFIDLRVWPVFNIADAAIVAGPIVALWNSAILA